MFTGQCQLFLFHVKGNGLSEINLFLFHKSGKSLVCFLGKGIIVTVNAVFMQLLLNNRVVVPENECIIVGLVLDDAEFGINVVLHLVVVTVNMVRSDLHQ